MGNIAAELYVLVTCKLQFNIFWYILTGYMFRQAKPHVTCQLQLHSDDQLHVCYLGSYMYERDVALRALSVHERANFNRTYPHNLAAATVSCPWYALRLIAAVHGSTAKSRVPCQFALRAAVWALCYPS